MIDWEKHNNHKKVIIGYGSPKKYIWECAIKCETCNLFLQEFNFPDEANRSKILHIADFIDK